MKTGPKCDTLFSQFWHRHAVPFFGKEHKTSNYEIMRWAYREGFDDRGKRDRKARSQANRGVKRGT